MKQKLTLLLIALIATMTAWATDVVVTISDKTPGDGITTSNYSTTAAHKYGTFSDPAGGTTFTTNEASGISGLTLTSTGNNIKAYYYSNSNYQYGLAVTPATGAGQSATVTIKAPDGYYIKSYSMSVISTSSNGKFTLTPSAASGREVSSSVTTFTPTSCANSASFTVMRNSDASDGSTELCFPNFTVTLGKIPTYDSNYTSARILYSTGTFSRTDGNTSTNSNNTWNSSELSGLRFTCNYNSMGSASVGSETYTCFHSGNSPTYTITAPDGYYIAGYTMTVFGAAAGQYLQPAGCGKVELSTDAANSTQIYVTDINASTATMQRSGTANNWAYISSFTVYLIPYFTVTYNIKDGGDNLLASYSENISKGTEITDLPALYKRGYCSYSMTSQTITSDVAIDVICTFSDDAPFVFATSVEDASTNNKWREFQLYNETNYVYYDGSNLAYTATDLSTADGYQWVLIGNPYSYKIYNKGAANYLSATLPTTNAATTSDFEFNSTGLEFELYKYSGKSSDNSHFVSVVKGTNTNTATGTVLNYSNGWKMWCGLNNTAGFVLNNGLMNGLSQSYLYAFEVPTTFNVTYNVQDGSGNVVATAVAEVAAVNNGDAASVHMPSILNKEGCTYTYSPTTVSESNNVITTTYSYDTGVGVEVYEDYSSISKWYFLKRNDTDYIVYDNASTPNVQRSTDLPEGDNASWAFVGNPFQGFTLYNKGAGNIVWAVSAIPSTDDEGAAATVSLAATGDVQKWFISSSTYHTNGFFLGNSSGYKLNGRASQTSLCYWTEGANGGSTFVAIENADYSSDVVSELGSFFTTNVGNNFALSQAAYDAQLANYTSYSSSATYKQYQDLKAAVIAGINYPATGYYRIKNVSSSNYIGFGTAGYSGKGNGLIEVSASDASSVVYLLGSGGVYTISSQGLNVQTQSNRNIPVQATSASGVSYTFTVLTPGVVSIRADLSDGKGYLFRSSWGTAPEAIITWEVSNDAAKWTVEEATSLDLTLNDGGDGYYYATVCLPFDVTLSAACAYMLTLNASETGLTMSEATDNVPAGTPVMLRHTEGTVTASIANSAAYVTSPLTTTDLTGTYVAKTVTGSTDYFLGMANGKVGFYHWDGSTLSANRAYLEASKLNNSGVKGFALDFEDDATSIQTIDNGQQTTEGAIYNVAGQRMNKMQKGINIINGKKILK